MARFAIASIPLAVAALAAAEAVATVTGVCPDGSMYIVPRVELIPCRDSKQVRPEDMPPIKPQNLPRPYGWEKFHRRNDPNNPYNLVEGIGARPSEPPAPEADVARPVAPAPTQGAAPSPQAAPPQQQASLAPAAAARPTAIDLGLAPEEIRDLALIVEYSQDRAPASFTRGPAAGQPRLAVRLARSGAFEERLRQAAQRVGLVVAGPAVLFSAVASHDDAFYANFTFVQGHLAFHPDKASSDQIGVIDGSLGTLAPNQRVLGYVVLPEDMDLGRPIDIYWNDRHLSATLRP